MKKRFLPVATAISAAFLLAACSETDVVDLSPTQAGNAADNAVTFSTYTAKKGTTRAGYKGNMTYDALAGKVTEPTDGNNTYTKVGGTGFGVFAYYTGKDKYGVYQGYDDDANDANGNAGKVKAPNFMYNQEVTAELLSPTTSNELYWTYSPLKYWPNDFADENHSDVDDNGATGSKKYGGNVSFFAYAPYVEVSGSADANGFVSPIAKNDEDSDKGITGVTANSTAGDPKIAYKIGSNVDLLWGTLDNVNMTTPGAGGQENLGVQGQRPATDGSVTDLSEYEQTIVENKWVAADLTKQKVNDQVKFNFIHALAAIGGSTEATPGTGGNSGFQVKLDIDTSTKGETTTGISEGTRQQFSIEENTVNKEGKTHYRTIVTITSVKINNSTMNDGAENAGTEIGKLHKSGNLNLATGQWELTDDNLSGEALLNQEIGTLGEGKADGVKNVELNPAIAEIKTPAQPEVSDAITWFDILTDKDSQKSVSDYFATGEITSGESVPDAQKHPGVTEDAQNVYEDADIAPLFLIPGDQPVFEITVEYVVRQYDEALDGECTTVKNKITKKVKFPAPVDMNKHYTLIMHLGLTSVKFTAKVSGWDKGDGKPTTGGSNPDTSMDDVEFELPSNVVSQPTDPIPGEPQP